MLDQLFSLQTEHSLKIAAIEGRTDLLTEQIIIQFDLEYLW